jgi:hypothetical protein
MKIEALIIHHSYSMWGNREAIDAWHRARGWKGIGYHRVICNGFPTYASWAKGQRLDAWDGKIQQGRPDTEAGAHTVGWNSKSLGICLVGNFDADLPTPKQWAALIDACVRLCRCYGLTAANIHGHREFAPKTCPGRLFPLEALKEIVASSLTPAVPV